MRDPSTEHPDPENAAPRDGSDLRTAAPGSAAPEPPGRTSWGGASLGGSGVFPCVLRGEIDFACRDELDELRRAFSSSACTSARVDVSTVSFVDSTALALLLDLRRVAADRGGQVVLVRPGRRLRRLLELAGVWPLFGVDDRSSC